MTSDVKNCTFQPWLPAVRLNPSSDSETVYGLQNVIQSLRIEQRFRNRDYVCQFGASLAGLGLVFVIAILICTRTAGILV